MKFLKFIYFFTFLLQQVLLSKENLLNGFPVNIFINKTKNENTDDQATEDTQDFQKIITFLQSRKIIQKGQQQEDVLQVTKNQVWEQEAFLFSFLILKKLLSINDFLSSIERLPNQFKQRQRYSQAYQTFELKLQMMHTFKNPTDNEYMRNLNIPQINEQQFREFDKAKDIPEKDQKLQNVQPQNYQLIKKKLFIQTDPFENLDFFELLDADYHSEYLQKLQQYIKQQSRRQDGEKYTNYQRGLAFLKYNTIQNIFFRSKINKSLNFSVDVPAVQDELKLNQVLKFQLSIDQMIQCLIDNQFLTQTAFQQFKDLRTKLYQQNKIQKLFYQGEDLYIIQVLCYRIRSKIIEALYNEISIDQSEVELTSEEFFNKQNFLDGIQQDQEINQNHVQIPMMTRNTTQDRTIYGKQRIYYQEVMLFVQQVIRLIFCNNDPQFRLISCFVQQDHFEVNSKCPKPIQKYVEYLSLYKEDVSFPVLINTINLYPNDNIEDVKRNTQIFIDYLFVYLRDQQITQELDKMQIFQSKSLESFIEANNDLEQEFIIKPQKNAHKMSEEDKLKLTQLMQQYEKSQNDIMDFQKNQNQGKDRKLTNDEFQQIILNRNDRNVIKINTKRLI